MPTFDELFSPYQATFQQLIQNCKTHKIAFSQKPLQRDEAVIIIQNTWRLYLQKKIFKENIYEAYTALIPQTNPALCALSLLMFGQRIAPFKETDTIFNPYAKNAKFYHRQDDIEKSSVLFSLFLRAVHQEKITEEQITNSRSDLEPNWLKHDTTWKKYTSLPKLYPITLLKLDEFNDHPQMLQFFSRTLCDGTIVKYPCMAERKLIEYGCSIRFLPEMPKVFVRSHSHYEILTYLKSQGLMLSLWQLSEVIAKEGSVRTDILNSQKTPNTQQNQYLFNLPHTKNTLLKLLIPALRKIPSPNYLLAKSAEYLLNALPELSSDAIKRSALIGKMTLFFHKKNYTQFSFFIYVLLHEISLGLSIENEDQKKLRFSDFLEESRSTCLSVLGLTPENILQHYITAALPANSGMHAYSLALNLAMYTKNINVETVGSCYFENSALHGIFTWFRVLRNGPINPDVCVLSFSAGPIVNSASGTLKDCFGTNINTVIKTRVIDKEMTKHVVLVVDATSAMYQNLVLNEESRKLVITGQISIIIFESHQKFGLLHTDQAQYGRVFALLNKNFYSERVEKMQAAAELDFISHLDMRIGAFINAAVPMKWMEAIKRQHFQNGEILYQFNFTGLPCHSTNAEKQLLFMTSADRRYNWAVRSVFPGRDSFGHFETTFTIIRDRQEHVRVSPSASNQLDFIIQYLEVFLMLHYDKDALFSLVDESYRQKQAVSFDQQVIKMALLSRFIYFLSMSPQNHSVSVTKDHYLCIKTLLYQCSDLKGLVPYQKSADYFWNLTPQRISQVNLNAVSASECAAL